MSTIDNLEIVIRKNPNKRQADMTDEEFIQFMKDNPHLWNITKKGSNAFAMRKGWVTVYNRAGEFSTRKWFDSHEKKMITVKNCLRSIQNMPGAYVEISYAKD